MEDELEPLKKGLNTAELERWNVEDLNAYKDRLRAEIARIDAAIAGKSSVKSLAENLFKS